MATLDDLCGRVLGEFVLIERIDEGGFGAVYRCDQPMLGRKVVVKVLHQQLRHDDAALERFKREAQLASRLDHPFAAHVYAFGTEHDGLLWIAMELVDGVTLDRWIDKRGPMSLEQLVPFFDRVAQVVRVAHQRGIVHRDLKPSNVMVIERAERLLPKLLDFGVARLLGDVLPAPTAWPDRAGGDDEASPGDPERTAGTAGKPKQRPVPAPGSPYRLTPDSETIGSPPYMAPEQWTSPLAVGPAADLYALAVIAYEALTGRRPFQAETAEEYRELHCKAPVPPLGGRLPAELDEVFQRALAKRPDDRFSSALELSDALRAVMEARMLAHIRSSARQWHVRGRPSDLLWRGEVLADLEQWIDRTGAGLLRRREFEFAVASRQHENALAEASRKHEAALAEASRKLAEASRRRRVWIRRGAVGAAVAMALFVIGALYARTAMIQQKANATQEVAEATAITAEVEQGRAAVLHDDLAEAQRHLAEACRRGDHSPGTSFMLARALQPLRAELARLPARSGRMWSAAFSPDGRQIVTTDDQAAQIWDARTHRLLAALPHGEMVPHAVYTSDGARLITAAGDGVVRIWSVATKSLLRQLRATRRDGKSTSYFSLAIARDLVAAIDSTGQVVHVWDANSGAGLAELSIDGSGWPSLGISADGHWLAAGGGNGVHVFETTTWQRVATIMGPRIRAMAWDPMGPRLLTGSSEGDVSLWEMPSVARAKHLREVGEPVDAVAFSQDGQLIAAAARDGAVHVWNAGSGQLESHSNVLRDKILSLEFDPASRLVAAAGANGAVAVSEAATGMPVTLLEGPTKLVRTVHFDTTSRQVIGASWDGTARVWDATSPYRQWNAPPITDDCDLVTALEPDRRYVAVRCRDRATRIWDTAHDALVAELPAVTSPGGDFSAAFPAVSSDGTRAAIARDHSVEVYELPGGRVLRSIEHGAPISAVAFATDDHRIVSGAIDGSVRVSADAGEPVALPPAPVGIDAVAFLPDGRVIAADARRRLRVIPHAHGAPLAELTAPTRIRLLRPSPDGQRLVTIPATTTTGPTVLWDIDHLRAVAELKGHVGQVFAARWIAGDRVLTAGSDGTARLWDGATGRLQVTYGGSTRFLADATLDPSGTLVVGGGADGLLRFWDAATGRLLWMTPAYSSPVVGIHFEGEDVITRGFGGEVSRWRLDDARSVIESCGSCAIVRR